jgi:beta-phosphoglucomutase-like phosphatase (HAD superfamily)
MEAAEALAFDFNGTLSDDEPLLLSIYQELFARHGRPLSREEYLGELAGNTEEMIIGTWLGVDGPLLAMLVQERIATYAERAASGSTVTRPVREAVRYGAARVPIAIVSGAFRAEIEPIVAAAGIASELSVIVTADDVTQGKPHPEGYLRAVQCLGVDPARTIAFEDTEAGLTSAGDAGLHCIAVRGTLPDERLGRADELVDAIDVALLKRLLG